MAIKPLVMKNLSALKISMPGVYEDLITLQESHNNILKSLGGVAEPVAQGGISVTASNGIIDVQIIDKHPEAGEDYFLEYDTQPSFATAHTVGPLVQRNYRNSTMPGTTTYWRWYKSTKLGGLSERITFGSPPTGVVSGNFSTTNPGPAPSSPQGSGSSQIPGYGYSSPRQNPKLPNTL